jgi:ribonuclease E
MADENTDEKESKVVQIKATTGAWWKSTATTEAAVAGTESVAGEADTPTEKQSSRAPRRPRRTSKKTVSEADPPTVGGGEHDGETIASAEEATPAASGGRSRRPAKRGRKKGQSAPAGEEQLEAGEPVVVKGAAQEPPVAGEGGAEEAKPIEQRKAKSNRGRRGRRGKKGKGMEIAENAPVEEAVLDDESVEFDRQRKAMAVYDGDDEAPVSYDDDDYFAEDEADEEEPATEAIKRVCKLLINAEEPEECRLALLEDGKLESIHVSSIARTQTKNNIYKARIVAIEPSLQAAFIDYGTEKNGFLPFSEIHPEYYKQDVSAEVRHLIETQQWKKIGIVDVVEKGQEVLAQVVKEEVGKKGANMTTYLSIPGRCVVLMPGSDSSGISRKISGEERRSQLREGMNAINLPEGIGWIVRTASVDITEELLSRDVKYLLSLWEEIKCKGQDMKGVGPVYEDQESVLRFLREHFDPSIEEILVDDRTALEQVKKFIEMLPEQQKGVKVRLHQGARPIFNQYSVEDQIESIYQPQVPLPSGGSIVINPTEALVAIDVNSGSTSKGKNFEASIFQANMEAAVELARQLRLRDLGGLIVVDFIDMRNRKHIMAVEKKVKESMRRDKAKVDFSRISKFGLMQISRQKLGAPIEAGNYRRCEHCKGRGTVKSVEMLALYYLRRIQTGASRKGVERIEAHFPLEVASYLLNNKRSELHEMEKRYEVEVIIQTRPEMKAMDHELAFHKGEKESKEKKQA